VTTRVTPRRAAAGDRRRRALRPGAAPVRRPPEPRRGPGAASL